MSIFPVCIQILQGESGLGNVYSRTWWDYKYYFREFLLRATTQPDRLACLQLSSPVLRDCRSRTVSF